AQRKTGHQHADIRQRGHTLQQKPPEWQCRQRTEGAGRFAGQTRPQPEGQQVNGVFHIRRGDVGHDEYHLQRAAMVMVFRWERHFYAVTGCRPGLPGWFSRHCVTAFCGLRPRTMQGEVSPCEPLWPAFQLLLASLALRASLRLLLPLVVALLKKSADAHGS